MFDKLMFFLSHGGLDLFLFILLIYFLYDVWVLYLEPLLTHEARQELEDRNLLLLKKHQLITLKKNCQADLEQQIDRIAQGFPAVGFHRSRRRSIAFIKCSVNPPCWSMERSSRTRCRTRSSSRTSRFPTARTRRFVTSLSISAKVK